MGWTSEYVNFGRGNNEALKELMASYYGGNSLDGTEYEVIYQSVKGGQIYQAIEGIRKDGERFVYANVILVKFEGRELYYKAMDESMCPYYFNAPKKLIGMLTPTDNQYSNEWREKVMEQFNVKKDTVKVGDIVKFDEPLEFSTGWVADTFEYCVREEWNGKKKYFFKIVVDGMTSNRNVRITNWRKKKYSIVK